MAKLEVITPMAEDRFEIICDAGAELHAELVKVLTRHGLSYDADAASVLLVATGGVFTSMKVDPGEFIDNTSVTRQFWRADAGSDGGVRFAPPHREPGFAPAARDTSAEN